MALFDFEELLVGTKKLYVATSGINADNNTITGNPILIGGRYSSIPTMRNNGTIVTLETDKYGKLKTVTTLVGSVLEEQKTELDAINGILTFSESITAIEIYNTDTFNDGLFVVNGIGINVPKGKIYKSCIGGVLDITVTITGASTYIVSRYT